LGVSPLMARLTAKIGVQPPLVRILCGLANVAATVTVVPEVVITSANDGRHKDGSLHYRNAAVDIRVKNLPDEPTKRSFLAALVAELGDADYDFLYEDPGGPNQHIHIEFDPHRH
jgi:hypothetical protein